MYDIDKIKEIPIKDVCDMLDIQLKRNTGSIRNERTGSFTIHPQKNIWKDWGTNEGGSIIDLVMKAKNVDNGKAIQELGEHFNIPKENSTTYNPFPTKKQFAEIGIISDRTLSNFDLDLQKQSLEKMEELESKYSISINELSQKNPQFYHKILDKKALPIISDERNFLIDMLKKYSKETSSLDRAFMKSQITTLEQSLNDKIDIYNKARLDGVNKDSLRIKAIDRLPEEHFEVNIKEVYTFEYQTRNVAKELLPYELSMKVGDLYYSPTLMIDKENGTPLGLEVTEEFDREDYYKMLSGDKEEFINTFYLEPLYEDFTQVVVNDKFEENGDCTLAEDFHIWKSGTKIDEIKEWFYDNYNPSYDFYLLEERYPFNFIDKTELENIIPTKSFDNQGTQYVNEIPNDEIEDIQAVNEWRETLDNNDSLLLKDDISYYLVHQSAKHENGYQVSVFQDEALTELSMDMQYPSKYALAKSLSVANNFEIIDSHTLSAIDNIEAREQTLNDEMQKLEDEISFLDNKINTYSNDLDVTKGKYHVYSINKNGDEALVGATRTKKEARELGQDVYLKTQGKTDIKNLKDEISKLKDDVSNKRALYDVKIAEYKGVLEYTNPYAPKEIKDPPILENMLKDKLNGLNEELEVYQKTSSPDTEISEAKLNKMEEVKSSISQTEAMLNDIGVTLEEPYRYYLTQRPPSIGTHPNGTSNIISFDNKQDFEGVDCYGYVEYENPLTPSQIDDYELVAKLKVDSQDIAPKEAESIARPINTQEIIEREIGDIMEEIKQAPLIDMKVDKDVDVTEILDNLKNGVGNIFNNENFVQYLNFQSQFHNYSPSNNMLIAIQNPNATNVASFTKWKALGRTVNKGEKGIMILAPNVVKNSSKEILERLDKYGKTNVNRYTFTKSNNSYNISLTNNGKTVRNGLSKNELDSFIKLNKLNQSYIKGFRKTYVFDVSQTSGQTLPQFKLNKLNDNELLDTNGYYKNPLINVKLSEGGLFEQNQTLTFKQANSIFERKEKEVRELKSEYEAKGEYYPYLKQRFDVVLKPDSPLSGIARYNRVDIGDGEYNNLLEALKGEMKGYPDVFKTLEETLNSNDTSMETILALKNQLEATINDKNITLEYSTDTGKANGYFAPMENRICVNSEMSLSATTKTLMHEYVHSQLHKDRIEAKDNLASRQTGEIEAEATTYVVSKHFGFDTSEYSFDYVSTWARGKDVNELGQTLKTIKEASEKIINEIKAPLELELYNNKENIEEILKSENVTPNDKMVNNIMDINKETGKLNTVSDLSNAEKFKSYDNPELSNKIADTNKEIATNTVKVEVRTVSVGIER